MNRSLLGAAIINGLGTIGSPTAVAWTHAILFCALAAWIAVVEEPDVSNYNRRVKRGHLTIAQQWLDKDMWWTLEQHLDYHRRLEEYAAAGMPLKRARRRAFREVKGSRRRRPSAPTNAD